MKILSSQIIVTQSQASVATPASGFVTLFVDSANNHLTQKDSTGVFTDLTLSGADIAQSLKEPTISENINANSSAVVAHNYLIPSGFELYLQSNSDFAIH